MTRTEVGDGSVAHEAESVERNPARGRVARPGDRPGDRPERSPSRAGALWDIRDVSAYLRVPVSSVYKMTGRTAAVRIPHIRIGGKLRFRQTDVDRWLTLLTTSNIEALEKLRQKVSKVIHGDHP